MSTRTLRRRLRTGLSSLRPLLLLLALGSLASTASAVPLQTSSGTSSGGTAPPPTTPGTPGTSVAAGGRGDVDPYAPGLHPIPATPFMGFDHEEPGGVKIPQGPSGGWVVLPNGIVFRFLPWKAGDPIIEVLLLPPFSGHPTQPERFLLQWPMGPEGPWMVRRPMLIAFHPFSISEKNIFNTELPFLCAQRGWLLLAPLGLSDINTANAFSQDALDAILAMLQRWFVWDRDRMYTIGFSMGGSNAVSWSMRRQNPDKFRVAAVIDHTGPMDQVAVWNGSTTEVKSWLSNSWHFGGTPTTNPFAYDRVSPFRLQGTTANPNKAPVSNLAKHIPFFVHYNPLDSQVELVEETQALISYLQSKGANLTISTGGLPGKHTWDTLDMATALDWAGQFRLGPDPTSPSLFADKKTKWLAAEVRAKTENQIARFDYTVSPSTNSLTVAVTAYLQVLALDVERMGLDPAAPLGMSTTSNASGIQYVLQGYDQAPSTVSGFPLPPSWQHDAASGELTITPLTGILTNFTVFP